LGAKQNGPCILRDALLPSRFIESLGGKLSAQLVVRLNAVQHWLNRFRGEVEGQPLPVGVEIMSIMNVSRTRRNEARQPTPLDGTCAFCFSPSGIALFYVVAAPAERQDSTEDKKLSHPVSIDEPANVRKGVGTRQAAFGYQRGVRGMAGSRRAGMNFLPFEFLRAPL
jgi:hypothetical protein